MVAIIRALVLTTVLTLVTLQAAPQNSTTYTGIIEGTLMGSDSNESIGGAQITLVLGTLVATPVASVPTSQVRSTPGGISPQEVLQRMLDLTVARTLPAPSGPTPGPFTGIADNSGHFKFSGLAPGQYTVRAQRDGYFSIRPDSTTASAGVTASITVAANEPTPAVTMTMFHGAAMGGVILGPDGKPVVGATVAAFQLVYSQPRTELQSIDAKLTDDQGRYRLFWLPPGEYVVGVVPPGNSAGSRGAPPTRALADNSWIRTYYPNVADARDAQTVIVKEDDDLAGINIAIRSVITFRISGYTSPPLTGAPRFILRPRNENVLTERDGFTVRNTAPDTSIGQFVLEGVKPGSYDLIVHGVDEFRRSVDGRRHIEVGTGNVNNVAVSLSTGVDVTVHVVDGDFKPLPAESLQAQIGTTPPRIQISLQDTENPNTFAPNRTGTIAPNGAIVFANIPEGYYRIIGSPGAGGRVSGLTGDAYVSDVRQGGVSVFDSGFEVTAVSPEDIDIVLRTDGGTVEGTVSGASGQSYRRMALVPQQSHQQNTLLFRTVYPNASNGEFIVHGVPPGTYKLYVWEVSPALYSEHNSDFIGKYESLGLPVTVRASVTSHVEPHAIPSGTK